MASQARLKRLLNQAVTIEPLDSRDEYDKPTFSAGVQYVARVEPSVEALRQPDDTVVISTAKVWLPADAVVDVHSRITLPDGTQPRIYTKEAMPGRGGDTFYIMLRVGDDSR